MSRMNLKRTEEKHRHKIVLITCQVNPSTLSYPVSLESVFLLTGVLYAWFLRMGPNLEHTKHETGVVLTSEHRRFQYFIR